MRSPLSQLMGFGTPRIGPTPGMEMSRSLSASGMMTRRWGCWSCLQYLSLRSTARSYPSPIDCMAASAERRPVLDDFIPNSTGSPSYPPRTSLSAAAAPGFSLALLGVCCCDQPINCRHTHREGGERERDQRAGVKSNTQHKNSHPKSPRKTKNGSRVTCREIADVMRTTGTS